MRELYYIADTVEPDAAAMPQWLAERLERWFAEIADEPLPEQLNGLLRRFEDEAMNC